MGTKPYIPELRCVTINTAMASYDDTQQKKQLDEIRVQEEERSVERNAKIMDLPYIDLSGVSIQTDALKLLPESESREKEIALFKVTGKHLYAAIRDSGSPAVQQTIKDFEAKGYLVSPYMVSQRSLNKAWDRYQDISMTRQSSGLLDISEDALTQMTKDIHTNQDVAAYFEAIIKAREPRMITRLMELIFGAAIATGASDIHIEPQEQQVRLRYRQDGVLQDVIFFSHDIYKGLNSRIKLLSEMKLTNEQDAQDGRFTINYKGEEVEIRSSIIPGSYGESVVMRILNPEATKVGFDQLGIEPRLLATLENQIAKPNGLILTTGPTGSGKTTTLYSFLRKVYTPEIKILTIEDPIEYHLTGITQTQVDSEKGYTFLSGLRAALRQDPDVIMVGEIRDTETAKIAINASLTGHLVLSTLHTNNAAGAIPRLIDLGVTPEILSSGLSVSIAQRLVRKLCPHCKKERATTPEEEELLRRVIQHAAHYNKNLNEYGAVITDEQFKVYEPVGCSECNVTGYKGRVGIYEAILMDENVEHAIYNNPTERAIQDAGDKQGILNMKEDGVVKILSGITSIDEVIKVVDLEYKAEDMRGGSDIQTTDTTPISIITPQEKTLAAKKTLPEHYNTATNTASIIETPSVPEGRELAFLVDHLKQMENEQRVNPNESAADKLHMLRETILDMIKRMPLEMLFASRRPEEEVHNEINFIMHDLKRLQEEQKVSPSLAIADRLRSIRSTIENL